MLPKSICFVDLETTGTQAHYDKIIEIGIVKVEDGAVTARYKQLLNPNTYLDPYIEQLTGICAQDLEDKPTFESVKHKVLEILDGSIFVAHNVRFDYGFLKNEFRRSGLSFRAKHLCTVKLSRLLYPQLGRYNLDSVMAYLGISCKNRHRAYDDAFVLWELYRKAQKEFSQEKFDKAIASAMKRPTIPAAIDSDILESLPESPGVYIFYGENNAPLYIGKSLNVYDRVLSHFSNDYQSTTDMKLSQDVRHIEAIPTARELGALLLESKLIKTHQPLLNKMLRHSRKINTLFRSTNREGYMTVEVRELNSISIDDAENIIGTFRSRRQVKDFLHSLAKEHKLCPKLLNLEKTKKSCFNYQLGYCRGACLTKEKPIAYNLRFDHAFYKHKIKPWKFEKPIVIKEVGDFEEHFVIDKWCYLGSFKRQDDRWDGLSSEYNFDLDTYKILSRFILNPRNAKKFTSYDYQ